jgi:hypothetical protein
MSWAIIPSRASIAVCISAGLFAASVGMIVDATRAASNVAREPVADDGRGVPVDVGAEPPDAVTIVDVSHAGLAMTHASIEPLLGLAAGEQIVAIGGRSALEWDGPRAALAYEWAQAEPGDYLDLEVAPVTGDAHRRVLVVVHP